MEFDTARGKSRNEFRTLIQDWAWNVFDVLMVGMNLVETALVGANFDIAYIRILRLSRVARTLRVVRSAPFLIKLRTMVNAIVNSIPSLFWAFSLLAFVDFVFGTIFAQGIVQVLDTQETFVHIDYIQRFCASLPMTLLTLFMAITSGISWWDLEAVVSNPLFRTLSTACHCNKANAIYTRLHGSRTDRWNLPSL